MPIKMADNHPLHDERVPSNLEVDRFASSRQPEIDVLLNNVRQHVGQKAGIDALPRHLRRRTNAHKSYTHLRRPNAKKQKLEAQSSNGIPQEKWENRRMRRNKTRMIAEKTNLSENDDSSKPCWLETHIWHAKRMHMSEWWGYMLAEHAFGKGHGSRSFCHKLDTHLVMHDASYLCPVLLSGYKIDLLTVFSKISDPSSIESLARQGKFWEGMQQNDLVLHHPNKFPLGCISPCNLIASPGLKGQHSIWIWIHPSAVNEAIQAIHSAGSDRPVKCEKRKGQLRRINVYGKKADSSITSTFKLGKTSGGTEASDLDKGLAYKTECLKSWESICSQGVKKVDRKYGVEVMHLNIKDPRLSSPILDAGFSDFMPPSSGQENSSHSLLKSLFEGQEIPLALSEKEISHFRHEQRLEAQQLSSLIPSTSLEKEIQKRAVCPVVFVRKEMQEGNSHWSLILPSTWAKPFWECLAQKGAVPAGQWEWSWASQHAQIPNFPQDYPDTNSGLEYDMLRSANDASERRLRPKGKYPEAIIMNWNSIGSAFSMGKKCLEKEPQVAIQDLDSNVSENMMEVDGDHGDKSHGSLLPKGSYVDRTSLQNIQESIIPSDKNCYISSLITFSGPGTAEFGAFVFGCQSKESTPELPSEEKDSHLSEKGLDLDLPSIPKDEPKIRGTKIAGHILLGYITCGGVRGLKSYPCGTAIVRRDLLLQYANKKDSDSEKTNFQVLVQNPKSTVSHIANAEPHLPR